MMAVVSTSANISLPIFLVDAFAAKQFQGNPAAVCLLQNEILSDVQMLQIAQEMKQSETAFVSPVNQADNFQTGSNFNLRWFTPTNEVNLCGHATMATSAVIFEKKCNVNEQLTFHTRSGQLMVKTCHEDLVMDFPMYPTVPQEESTVKELIKIVVDDLLIKEVEYSEKTGKLLIRLQDSYTRNDLENLKPDTTAMMKAQPNGPVKGVIITLKGSHENGATDDNDQQFDFISRYFAPWNGIPEDPVTGAAHTVLASYWSRQLNKTSLYARQCSARGGNVRLTVKETRVDLAGKASIVVEGKINLNKC
ncbi:phenazine biosynthesis-like domain-containing protein isoform X2 [Antedon mediterranea]|uniref:phenazine biosynthesis-like domain-containing protein isoform X2 n=1 Tax=Antedon mediterranea TaxID=105859 RepID=UPI003AF63143